MNEVVLNAFLCTTFYHLSSIQAGFAHFFNEDVNFKPCEVMLCYSCMVPKSSCFFFPPFFEGGGEAIVISRCKCISLSVSFTPCPAKVIPTLEISAKIMLSNFLIYKLNQTYGHNNNFQYKSRFYGIWGDPPDVDDFTSTCQTAQRNRQNIWYPAVINTITISLNVMLDSTSCQLLLAKQAPYVSSMIFSFSSFFFHWRRGFDARANA